MEKILFLRYVVTTQCIEKDEEKVKVIQDWPTSKSVTEVRSFYKLVELVREGTIQRYWLEQDLLYAKGGRIFVLKGALQKYLMTETHDPQWAGHPGRERMVALLSQTYYWPKMEDDVELYVRTCLVCQ
jgi:ribonucleotide monophosphatase NagD (HAD superfamily)